MTVQIQKYSVILLWIFLAVLYGLQIDSRLYIRGNREMIKQSRDSTSQEHKSIIDKQDSLIKILTH